MKCDELEKFDAASNADLSAGYDHRYAYEADEVDEAIAELKAKLENVQASAYAESVDAGMRERKLQRALWLARAMRAYRAQYWGAYVEYVHFHEKSFYEFDGDDIFKRDNQNNDSFREWNRRWVSVERKCRAKAEEYK